jgi:hypothetical protein
VSPKIKTSFKSIPSDNIVKRLSIISEAALKEEDKRPTFGSAVGREIDRDVEDLVDESESESGEISLDKASSLFEYN